MALKRDTRYPGRFNTANAAHPQGAFKNRSTPTAQDGSYLEADWANDWSGLFEALLSNASITPNGNVDTATSSQYFTALTQLFMSSSSVVAIANGGTGATTASSARNNLGLGSVATESTVPVNKGGTGTTTVSGIQTLLGLGSAAYLNTGNSAANNIPTMGLFTSILGTTGYQRFPSGFTIQWGTWAIPGNNAVATISMPFTYPTGHLWNMCAFNNSEGTTPNNCWISASTGGTFTINHQGNNAASGTMAARWVSFGY